MLSTWFVTKKKYDSASAAALLYVWYLNRVAQLKQPLSIAITSSLFSWSFLLAF